MRRLLQITALLCTLIVGAGAVALIVTQTAWFKDWLRGFIVRQADDYLHGQLTIGRLGGNLFFGVELENVELQVEGERVIRVQDVGLDYNVVNFITRGIVLDDIRINQPYVLMRRTEAGWNLQHLVRREREEAEREGPGRPVSIGSIGIADGTIVIDDRVGTDGVNVPERIERLDARIGFEYEPVDFTVEIGHLSFQTVAPAVTLTQLSGRVATKDDTVFVDDLAVRTGESALSVNGTVEDYQGTPRLNLTASSDRLTLQEIGRIVPALETIDLHPAFTLETSGPLEALEVGFEARSEAGQVRADVTADVTAPERRVAGTVHVQQLNVGRFLGPEAQPSNITARAEVDLRIGDPGEGRALDALAGTYRVDAPQIRLLGYEARNVTASGRIENGVVGVDARADAYGGRTTVEGTVAVTEPVRLDLRGRASGLDLRNLPPQLNAPRVPSRIDASYRARGTVGGGATNLQVDTTLGRSTLAGAEIEPGSTARVAIAGETIAYAADVRVRDLDLQRIGQGFGIEALAEARYASTVNGSFAVSGRGTSLETLVLEARGSLVDSALFGGRVPAMTFDAALDRGRLRVQADGSFAGFDPATLAERPELAGTLDGSVDVDVTIADLDEPLAPEGLEASGTVRLAESRVGEIVITDALVAGTYANRAGELEQLTVEGPDLRLRASGPVDLTETGQTRVAYEIDMTDLSAVGRMFEQPVTGTVSTSGTLTGNAGALRASGSLQGSNLHYQEHTVLAVQSDYGVVVPELDTSRIVVDAQTEASLLRVAGQELTEVDAHTIWSGERLEVDATLADERRTVDAAANVIFHTDHQEIHLTNLAFRTQGIEWRTAPGSEAAIQYGENRVVVDALRLVSGNQQIAVDGALGQPDDTLQVDARNVELAGLNALALGEQRVEGLLDATATVRGTLQEPQVDAQFTVARGAISEFAYSSLGGNVQYGAKGLQFDATLAQTPEAWISARGTLPAAFFATPEETEPVAPGTRVAHEEPAPGEGMDITVTSSALDLAIVQGFVPQLTDVSGTLQADVRVTGTRRDPHLNGHVDIRNGSFTIAELTPDGYTGLDTRIELADDRVRIQEFRVLDEHAQPLIIAGELALHARQVGEMAITVKADGFEVIDNELADVKLNSDIRVTGELTAPRVEGEVSIASGTINIGRVFEFMAAEPYALRATTVEGLEGLETLTPPEATPVDRTEPDLPMLEPTAPPPAAPAAAAAAAEEEEAPAPGAFEALALDVRLTVPNNLVVRGRDLNPGGGSPIGLGDVNVTLGGDVRATKAPGEDVRLLGSINTVRGTYTFQGRRFDIQRDGRVQFTGAEELDPRLDITATRLIAGVEVSINVRGTAREPELQLSSRPPQDEADILSLIIFNQPVNALGEGQQVSLAQRASSLATGFVASTLAQSLGQALELDIFEIETTPERGGSPTVTIGEQVSERLFFRFRQAFGAQSVSEFILEYQLADFLRLQTSVAEGAGATQRTLMQRVERAGLDLIFFFTY